ncbi:sarcosine oxidase subunit beta family protein [Spiribacter salilacus]|nr:sarcosine oxidase subunit beta family protein [Spiribacter salilacus]
MTTLDPIMRYSAFNLFKQGLRGHRGWPLAWRAPTPAKHYDVIIIGGGGHGLATAYYLAKNHRVGRIAVLEKGWIGGGNTGRNTTIVRSNYMIGSNVDFYEWSMKLWEGLSQDLNFNVMLSQRGQFNLVHSDAQVDAARRRGNVMRAHGIDAELLDAQAVQEALPQLDYRDSARFPIYGALYQGRAGTARHDAVAWGYARAADRLGVDIIQNCEVSGFEFSGERVVGVKTNLGTIGAGRVGVAVAGNSGRLAQMAGFELPIESHILQAFVSESIKPCLDHVVGFGAAHFYISQSDKGGLVFGGDLDGYNSYAQRGNMPILRDVISSAVALMPQVSRLRLLRHWGGVMDMTMDGSPIIGPTPVDGLFLNGGWCYGGFKATPASGWCFAHSLANGGHHPLATDFTLERFEKGLTLDEKGMGPRPWAH